MKASTYNDGYSNLSLKVKSYIDLYIAKWRSVNNDYVFPVSSSTLGSDCQSFYFELEGRKFTFTRFRKLAQTIFDQTNFGPKAAEDKNGLIEYRAIRKFFFYLLCILAQSHFFIVMQLAKNITKAALRQNFTLELV